jgi:probable HAF family extracellular repeat protein
MVGLGFAAGDSESVAQGISGNGAVVVGTSYGSTSYGGTSAHAVAWASPAGATSLGDIPGGSGSFATAVNADGSVVVGEASLAVGGAEAFRWTAQTGMVAIGSPNFPSTVSGVSADGSVVVGSTWANSTGAALRWTASTGWVALGLLPGALSSTAYGVSADGSTVVGGDNRYGDIGDEAFRWTESTGSMGLGFLPGDNFSQANAVSADGSVVVGTSSVEGSNVYRAFVWTPATGMRSIQDLFAADGIDLTGWIDLIATGVSADGTVIVGNGIDPFGISQAWIANLPVGGAAAFSVSDPDGEAITQYDFWDTGTGGGHFVLNGQALGTNQDNVVTAAQLPQLSLSERLGRRYAVGARLRRRPMGRLVEPVHGDGSTRPRANSDAGKLQCVSDARSAFGRIIAVQLLRSVRRRRDRVRCLEQRQRQRPLCAERDGAGIRPRRSGLRRANGGAHLPGRLGSRHAVGQGL